MSKGEKSTLGIFMRAVVLIGLVAAVWIAFQMGRELPSSGSSGNAAHAATVGIGLHQAARTGSVDAVRAAIAQGADPNLPMPADDSNRAGMTPLMLASFEGSPAAVQVLIEAGARTEVRASDGRTALIYAAGWGNAQKVQHLLDAGATIDARASDGMTALMFAAARGDADSVRQLVAAGAGVDERNRWRQTALMGAARSGSLEKVQALLGAGASVDISDQYGDTALSIAAASSDAGVKVLEVILAAGGTVDAADGDGVTPLMKAAEAGDQEKVRVLLAAGASTALKDRANGWTARDWAAKRDDDSGRAIVAMLDAAPAK
jgi:ankyrin repeat protein